MDIQFDNPKSMWRLFECKDGKPHTLFHGNYGSRQLPMNDYIVSEKSIVYDGSDGTKYVSGFHVVPTEEEIKAYADQFHAPRHLVMCPVDVVGRVWEKSHSRANVYLARQMCIPRKTWESMLDIPEFNRVIEE